MSDHHYAGFWVRVLASLIDTVCMLLLILPALQLIYGENYWSDTSSSFRLWDLLLNYVFPALVVIVFWMYKSATPGKMLFKLVIIDEKTGGKPSTAQFVGRYVAYYLSTIPLCLGLIWVAFDPRKQGWHDKLAGTLVVKRVSVNIESVAGQS